MASKITETGPKALRGIRNPDLYPNASMGMGMGLSEDELREINDLAGAATYADYDTSHGHMGYSTLRDPATYTPQERPDLMGTNYGHSQYDQGLLYGEISPEDINEIRYENQPWYDTLANGMGKMLGTAGTTFISSLVGVPYGIGAAIGEGRWSALWDNDVTQGLAEADKWLEENMTNYRSQVQQNSPWYDPSNLFSMNFIADDIIKNMGFTLGAAASMAVGSGSLGLLSKSIGFVNDINKGTKMGQATLSALFSATGEGMIEARQGVEERNKLELQKLDDAFLPERQALELEFQQADQEYAANRGKTLVMGSDGVVVDPAYEQYKHRLADLQVRRDDLQQKYEAGKQQIIESGQVMGNEILLANQGLLTIGNLIQFGKGMVKSFDSARHAAEVSSKAAKPTFVGAKRMADGTYKITGKNMGRALAATKGILTEGSEEMNQQWIQSSSGASVNEADINDYWRARLDPDSYRETTKGLYTVGSILDRGFQESWGDVDQWEQFVVGAFTGMTGSYTPTKIFNQDKTKSRWNPARYGSWEGGAYNELKRFYNGDEYTRGYNEYQENINELNKILQSEDFPARIMSAVGHTFTQGEKDAAVEGDDKKAWKDADDKQMVHDIQAFLRAGKLDDLRTIYNELGTQLSDEDVQNIIKSTTKEITAEEDKQNFNKQADEQIALHQGKITELQQRAQDIGDSQDMLEGSERADYQAAMMPELEKIFGEIDAEYDAINNLEQQKEQYVPKKYYEGAYVDREGNQIVSDAEIRETIKHNSEELNRKLDSYLESIDAVNKDTKGTLSKDQEDNLAYLHHLGKESLVRADKIISDKRKQLPSKFLIKTYKTPEQLTKEYASSDLVFSKDENTKEGYVEVDTSLMDDRSFRNFFIGELLWGGNINPEFGETADEKAAREEEEKNLPEAEKKKRAKERLSKKWKEGLEKQKKDVEEQRGTNEDLITQNFIKNYLKNRNANQMELQQALNNFYQDIIDASSLISQAGDYDKTLREYMANPSLVDRDKAKAEDTAQQAHNEQQAKNKFAGKTAVEIKQDIANGDIDLVDLDAFINDIDSNDETLIEAQQEAKKAQEGNQKAAALKQHILESDANDDIKEMAMAMVDKANMQAENPEDINMNSEALQGLLLDMITPNANINDITAFEVGTQQVLAEAFNAFNEDEVAQSDIPDDMQQINDDVEAAETGHDATTKTKPEVVAPDIPSPSEAANEPLPKNPLTDGALDTIIDATSKSMAPQNTNGTYRSTTTRHPYGESTGTYHDNLRDKNSLQYKRSKAIWEYLNSVGAFDRQENSSQDRIKKNDTVHFMVKFFPEIAGDDPRAMTIENQIASMVIFMLNDNGEVIGDLPLAEFEPSYRAGNPTQQVKDLLSLQEKVFRAFLNNYSLHHDNEAIVDSDLTIEGKANLNLTFDNNKKPLVSRVKQVMRGVVPFVRDQKNTLNEVANNTQMELGVAVSSSNIAKRRGDKTIHRDIVMPHVGTTGQPYLLLPTPSGEQIAVPFYMKPFDANNHRNTTLYNLLTNAIYTILTNNTNKEVFKKNMDVIAGLLQVKAEEGVSSTIEVRKDSVTMRLQSLTDPNTKITITVPFNQNTSDLARAMVDQLSGIPINVSLQYLNDTIEAAGLRANYNNVIGEIADINLPKSTNHTVNGWFTIESTSAKDIKPSKKLSPKTTGVISETIGGRDIEINTESLVAYDPTTGEVITDNEEINLRLAQIKAAKPQYQSKDKIQVSINRELRTYDVKDNKFVKNAPIKKDTSEQSTMGVVLETEDTSSSSSAASLTSSPRAQTKTLEHIENEMKQKKIVRRDTKDAWDAIPNDLKLKLVNEGQSLQLSFNGKMMIVSIYDREGLIQGLTQANMAAKAGKLNVSEVVKPMEKTGNTTNKENEQAARRWLAKNLPMLSSEERTQFVEKLARMGDSAGKYWGSYRSGVIQIQRNAPMGTVYHEAFHYVLDMVLDAEERKQILDIAKQEYGIDDSWEAEERLANDFRRYAMDENATGFSGRLRRWFRAIRDKVMRYNRISDATINQLFWKINNGELAQRSVEAENFDDNQQRVLREIRNVQREKYAWVNLPSEVKGALKSSGLSEADYNKMSLEEKDQYVKCRG